MQPENKLKKVTKLVFKPIFIFFLPTILIISTILLGSMLIVGGAVAGGAEACESQTQLNYDGTEAGPTDANNSSSASESVVTFVKQHQEAYIQSWGVGGFLPSASIVQTMIETSFSMGVPSFASAHNMGGVKWTSAATYPKTIALYGSDAVSGSGAGTGVGDNTGGGYTWFKSFDAGIVGKAEFMSRQSLYVAAINNTDGKATLDAIAAGGWATDPSYKTKLDTTYDSLGSQFKWLDKLAIEKYGEKPVDLSKLDSLTLVGLDGAGDDDLKPCEEEDTNDGDGDVPADATSWGYTPDTLIASLKPYVHDPAKVGLKYCGPDGWLEHSGQCVDLTESLGNIIWGFSGITVGDGYQQASAWAKKFGNSVKNTPKSGAIFSSGASGPGHTGIVSHVFKDGSILIIEQNSPLSGAQIGKKDTWNYRIVRPATLKSEHFVFAYPDNKKPNWK